MSDSSWAIRKESPNDATKPENYGDRVKAWGAQWGTFAGQVKNLEFSKALNTFNDQFQPQYTTLPDPSLMSSVGWGEVITRGIANFLTMIWYVFLICAIIIAIVNVSKNGWKAFVGQAQAAVKKNFKDDFTGLPYSTLPNGIPMTGSGDAMANSSASFYGDDAMVQTGFFGQESAAQDLYGHFDDEQRFIGADDPAVAFADDPAVAFADDPAVAFADEEKFFDGGITPNAADSQLTYGTFLDDSQYQTFADTIVASASMKNKKQAKPGKVPPMVVKNGKLPGRWGSCANRKKFVPKKNSDEYLARNWSGRLL